MNRLFLAACALAGALAVTGCADAPPPAASQSSGSLALTSDDALLYAVDQDNEFVAVIDTASQKKVAEVKVGRMPERILLDSQDRAFVANRADRSVSVFQRGVWDDVQRIPVGVEPVGLALSPDEKVLYVVNAASLTTAEKGSLMAVDTKSLQVKWDMDLPPEPRSIALVDGATAYVTLFKSGDLVQVNLADQKITRGGTTVETALNRTPDGTMAGAPMPNMGPDGKLLPPATVTPHQLSQIVLSRDGSKLYVTSTLASNGVLASGTSSTSTDPSTGVVSGDSSYGGGSGCTGGGSVSAPAVLTFRSGDATPMVDPVQECFNAEARDYPSTLITADPFSGVPVQGPSALVLDQTGTWLYVANRESNNVAILKTSRSSGADTTTSDFSKPMMGGLNSSVRAVVQVGSAPTGLALSHDNTKLYVHNAFDHSVQLVRGSGSGDGAVFTATTLAQWEDPLPANVAAGRKLFFNAQDPRMNSPTVGISCASCHLEGREDGHVWNFDIGPRQTPSLAGRMLSQTAPFHWGGEHVDFKAFVDHTIGTRMGGTGLTDAARANLLAYIDTIPAPDNPNKLAAPSDAQLRGAQAFQKAECSSCHAGQTLTNNTNANVGTFVTTGAVLDDTTFFGAHGGINTPSLLGLARTAPYLHDGSALTLKDRILKNKALDLHGKTSVLSDSEVDDLVEYLKAL